jgi:signal transduction histidine kinase
MLSPAIPKDLQAIQAEFEPPLSEAFSAFSQAARSLEVSYFTLGEEVRRLRQELEQERELRRRREALAEMAALVAHEVRNPLGSVELFAELLAGSGLEGEERQWVLQIQAGLKILSASVGNVLQFHSPAGSPLVATDLRRLLRCLRQQLAPVAVKAGIEIVLEDGEELRVLADPQRLLQAFLNIALNAFHFAAAGKWLRIQAAREQSMAVVAFEDRGPGVPEAMRRKIFEAGFTTRAGGPGLGMAVAQNIIAQHGGSIQVTSASGGGASFAVSIPLPDQTAAIDLTDHSQGASDERCQTI